MKPSMPAPMPPTASPSTQCSNCGVHASYFLHPVRLANKDRRLCTSCVLRLHPASFCPSCFSFFGAALPHASKRVSCSKCSSITHAHCAPTYAFSSSTSSSYICPPCKDPNFSFFNNQNRRIDERLAVVLLCAAKIAAASMAKAMSLARQDVEKKVKEAAESRKRARDTLERFFYLDNKEKARRKEEASMEVSNAIVVYDAKVETENGDGDVDDDVDADEIVRHLENTLVKEELLEDN